MHAGVLIVLHYQTNETSRGTLFPFLPANLTGWYFCSCPREAALFPVQAIQNLQSSVQWKQQWPNLDKTNAGRQALFKTAPSWRDFSAWCVWKKTRNQTNIFIKSIWKWWLSAFTFSSFFTSSAKAHEWHVTDWSCGAINKMKISLMTDKLICSEGKYGTTNMFALHLYWGKWLGASVNLKL